MKNNELSRPDGACNPPEHTMHRRLFLQGALGAGAASLMSWNGLFSMPAFAAEVKKKQKHCILLWLCGAPSQFETWDPKPNSIYSGPFGSVPTKIPGVRFGEMMSQTATIADKLSIVRSMKTKQGEHFQAINLLQRGAEPREPFVRPTLGSVLAQQLGHLDSPIPNFVLLDPCPEGNEFKEFKAGNWAGWLGAQYGPVRAGGEYKLEDVKRLPDTTTQDAEQREALRKFLTRKFENDRASSAAASQNAVFNRVKGLMSCADLFDLEKVKPEDRARYGPGTFGLHTLLARNLVENGAPFVMVANGMPWDCHVFQHEIYQMLVPELDRVIFNLISDLDQRGLLDSTLVVMMGEFGRTPWLNVARGRDHYPDAWSLALAGCGIKRGMVVGATDPDGVDVVGKPFNEKNLFATIFTALGIDPYAEYDEKDIAAFYRVEDHAAPIREILA